MKNQVHITTNPSCETFKVYKVRRKSDGLYSNGGSWPYFNIKGKEWRTLSAVSSHIAQVTRNGKYNPSAWEQGNNEDDLSNIEIVTYECELKKTEVSVEGAVEYHEGIVRRRHKREARQATRKATRKVEQAKCEFDAACEKLNELTAYFGN
jgi:hypothetical protein